MPTANFKRLNLDLLMPEFRDRLFEVIARCNARGHRYVATSGFRGYADQTNLWKVGRVVPGKKVTNARGGESQHNFGLAVDFVYDTNASTPGVEPSWADGDYDVLIEELLAAGLHSGIGYSDRPHVGWSTFFKKPEIDALDRIWKLSSGTELERLGQVWQYVLANTPELPPYKE